MTVDEIESVFLKYLAVLKALVRQNSFAATLLDANADYCR